MFAKNKFKIRIPRLGGEQIRKSNDKNSKLNLSSARHAGLDPASSRVTV
jgi:hypothetical protein